MGNKVNNKIGCEAGRTKIVDPNNFNGFNSESNISVPLEDLNISVVLRTTKKGRTVLTNEKNGTDGTIESTKSVEINFIQGSKVGKEKVLTTKFTDLTTIFDKGVINSETLGISSIDIDFNSSYAPNVTINFIDVRGSSIFQNEELISGNNTDNKYSTFFQMPYPIFELEIKGYYGKPVTYCLHMLKFVSKFNSQTGNFEMQANFVGYTYAMFSDMLIGYLKAIEFTEIGGSIYKTINDVRGENEKVLTLVGLIQKISKINKGLEKISATSENSKAHNAVEAAKLELDNIQGVIKALGSALDMASSVEKEDKETYPFIVKLSKPFTELQTKSFDLYKTNVEVPINKFNELDTTINIKLTDFTSLISAGKGKGFYPSVSRGMFNPANSNPVSDAELSQKIGSPKEFEIFKRDVFAYLSTGYKINDDTLIDIYDMSLLVNKLDECRTKLDAFDLSIRKALAVELKEVSTKALGFEPTVRKIIEIFTVAIEVFMETLLTVSIKAEGEDKDRRNTQLISRFGKDINTSDIKDNAKEDKVIYAWPDYREKDSKINTYVEKYLGSPGVLNNPKDVTELVFIDDLKNAFIKAEKAVEAAQAESETVSSIWYPVSPVDTAIFTKTPPYQRSEMLSYNDVVRMLLIRAVTFFYSNDPVILTDKDIISMAKIEVDELIRTIKNKNVIQALVGVKLDYFKKIGGTINETERDVIRAATEYKGDGVPYIYYDYIFNKIGDPISHKLIPISTGFNNFKWENNNDSLRELAANGVVFLTNHSSANHDQNGKSLYKDDDGGIYVKIITKEKFTESQGTLVTTTETVTPESTFNLAKLQGKTVDASAGYNCFGGTYGIQEFVNMDYGTAPLKGLDLMYVFYKDSSIGLATDRINSGVVQKTAKNAPTNSYYDFTLVKKIPLYDDKEEVFAGTISTKYVHSNLGQNRVLFNQLKNGDVNITYPYVDLRAGGLDRETKAYEDDTFSLFGSQFYYLQNYADCKLKNKKSVDCSQYVKAMLFLNTLPFNVDVDADPFEPKEIRRLFNKKAGFIHAPRLWCAWIGSLLWRINPADPEVNGNGEIVGGGRGTNDPTIMDYNCYGSKFDRPDINEYFPPVLSNDGAHLPVYSDIKEYHIINKLPEQVKKEFRRIFFEFVNGSDDMISFSNIASKLEIWKGSAQGFCDFVTKIRNSATENEYKKWVFDGKIITKESDFINLKNYEIITTGTANADVQNTVYLFLALKGNYSSNEAVRTLIDAMKQEVIIVNTDYKIWNNDDITSNVEKWERININETKLDLYLNSVIEKLAAAGDSFSPTQENKRIEQEVFNTTNLDTIKFQLYRTCKNVHDKWLAGITNPEDMIFQCGNKKRNTTDSKLSFKHNKITNPKLIDSFRFISRSYRDIGDELFINPIPINNYLIENPNSSAYNGISTLLSANNFEFIALPSFINYKESSEVEAIFTPYPSYEKAIDSSVCGPSFVCAYIGQKSKFLDINNSNYPNDGVSFRCIDGDLDPTAPDDFKEKREEYEDGVAVFSVKYSQQNQNIFKDITLDQSEYSETDESIQIQDNISQKGSENNRTIAGQNLYNVWSVRSYTAQVEMMGNAMIQPMMYFQLDNIPMFHGAYMITHVKHSIRPNHMSTNFTGQRIRYAQTPLIDGMDLYMSLLETMDTTAAGTGPVPSSTTTVGRLSPVVNTIYENGGLNGAIAAGKITTKQIPKIAGINNLKLNSPTENILLSEAVDPLVAMLTDWVAYQKTDKTKFKGSGGIYGNITSVFRDYAKQKSLENNGGAVAGTSYHGWGVAIDLQFFTSDGKLINNTPNTASSFNVSDGYNPSLKWLLDNSYKYGWILPYSLRDKSGEDEHWHFEYHGTAAKCLYEKNPTTYGHTTQNIGPQKPVVKNPNTKDGKPAVYTDCDYKLVKDSGDGVDTPLGGDADYWSLLSICSLEAGEAQGRCDVAQSIYNRLATPKKPYGKSIKEIIVAEKQFEPTFKNPNQWQLIKDEETAIKAVMGSKGWTREKAKSELQKTNNSLKNKALQNNSKTFIGTRTEFLATRPTSKSAEGIVERTPSVENNVFYWRYAGKALIGKTPPNPPSQLA